MRSVLGVMSLLIVLAVVGFLAKKQFSSVSEIKLPAMAAPAGADVGSGPAPGGTPGSGAPSGNVQQQSQQIQQQFKAAADAALQQARPMPDEK